MTSAVHAQPFEQFPSVCADVADTKAFRQTYYISATQYPSMTDDRITELLGLDRVAVIGCSSTPGKDAHEIPRYLVEQGYDVIPVNPYAEEIFGRQAHDTLTAIAEPVDLVTVFRPGDEVPDIVDRVLTRRDQRGRDDPEGLWLQLGITNQAAITRARDAGIIAVQNHCMKIEHQRTLD